ncbi:MAG: hypothetical protein II261_11070, partial [Bacteroidaceae bacterium]|nr:hypothetical protein [Bacteroidaceae bacterium]
MFDFFPSGSTFGDSQSTIKRAKKQTCLNFFRAGVPSATAKAQLSERKNKTYNFHFCLKITKNSFLIVLGRGCRRVSVAKKCSAEAAEHFLWLKSVRQPLPRTKFHERTIRMWDFLIFAALHSPAPFDRLGDRKRKNI